MKISLRILLAVLLVPALSFAKNVPGIPFWNIDFSASVVSACAGEKIQFTDLSSFDASDPVISWNWNFGDGAQSTVKNPEHTYSSTGSFDVTLVVTKQSGDKDTLSKNAFIQIRAALQLSFGNDTAICEGSAITLNAGNAGATYLWSTGESTQTIVVSEADMYIVEVSNNGCSRSDTINVNLRPELFPDFKSSANGNCLPASVSFTDLSNACPGYTINHWHWDFGDGTNSSEQNPTHTYVTAGTYTVRLTIFDEFGTPISRNRRVVISEGSSHKVNLGADTTICSGSSVILNAGNTGAEFEWSTGERYQEIETFFPGEYWVKVTKDGCTVVDTIVVNTSERLTARYDYEQQGSCVPAPVQFTDRSESCNSRIVEWLWDFGDGTTSADKNPVHVFQSTGSFTVRLTVKDNLGSISQSTDEVWIDGTESPRFTLGPDTTTCEGNMIELNTNVADAIYSWNTGDTGPAITVEESGNYIVHVEKNGCATSDTIYVRFMPALIPQFAYKQQPDCSSINVKFSDSSETCSASISNWEWDFGDGTISAQQHPAHIYSAGGEYLVKLKVTTSNGQSLTRSKKIKLGSYQPTTNLDADTLICFGTVLTLNPGVPDATSYTWSTGETTPEIQVTEDGDYSVIVNVNGCHAYDTIQVRTRFPIIPAWAYTTKGKCLPVETQFGDSSITTCGAQLSEWYWEFGDGATSQEQHPIHTYTQAGTFTVKLTVRTAGGVSISRTKQVVIENTDFELDLGDELQVCTDNNVQLNAGISGATYVWTPAAGLDNPTSQTPVASPIGTMVYKVAVTKCMITHTDSIQVSVNDIPEPTITINKEKLVAPTANAYKWYRNGQLMAGETSQTISPKSIGKYSVEVFNKQGCSAVSQQVVYMPESRLDRQLRGVRVKLWPNPARGILQVAFERMPSKKIEYTIYNATGRKVHGGYLPDSVNFIDLSKLSSGQYYVECVENGARVTLPFLIQ